MSLHLEYAEPLCHSVDDQSGAPRQVKVLHLRQLPVPVAPAAASPEVGLQQAVEPAVATAQALAGITTAAFSSTLTTGTQAAATACRSGAQQQPQGAPRDAGAATARALQGLTTAAFSSQLPSDGSSSGSDGVSARHRQGSPEVVPAVPGAGHQLLGMLFRGSTLVASYAWPLAPNASGAITAAMVLPVVQHPCVLQLVLVEQFLTDTPHSTSSSTTSSSRALCSSTSNKAAGWVSSAAFARLPLLFLPRGAAQEVETLLVPAMRQEAAVEAAAAALHVVCSPQQHKAQQQPAKAADQPGPSQQQQLGRDGMQLLHSNCLVNQHWCNLADDIGRVWELAATWGHDTNSNSPSWLLLQELLLGIFGFLQQQGLHQCCAALLAGLPPQLMGPWCHQQQQQVQGMDLPWSDLHAVGVPALEEQAAHWVQLQQQQQRGQAQSEHTKADKAALCASHPAQGRAPAHVLPLGVTPAAQAALQAEDSTSMFVDAAAAAAAAEAAAVFKPRLAPIRTNSSSGSSRRHSNSSSSAGPNSQVPPPLVAAAASPTINSAPPAGAAPAVPGGGANAAAEAQPTESWLVEANSISAPLPLVPSCEPAPAASPLISDAGDEPWATPTAAAAPAAEGPGPFPSMQQLGGLPTGSTQEISHEILDPQEEQVMETCTGGPSGRPAIEVDGQPGRSTCGSATVQATSSSSSRNGVGVPPCEAASSSNSSSMQAMQPAVPPSCSKRAARGSSKQQQQQEEEELEEEGTGLRVNWRTSWHYFATATEQQYMEWQHQHQVWFLLLCAGFILLHLLALVARAVTRQDVAGHAPYMYFLAVKSLPYWPLLVGRQQALLRWREPMVAGAAQVLCMLPMLLRAVVCDQVVWPRCAAALQRMLSWGPAWAQQLQRSACIGTLVAPGLSASPSAAAMAAATGAPLPQAAGMPRQLPAWLSALLWQACRVPGTLCAALVVPSAGMSALWRVKADVILPPMMPLVQRMRLPYMVAYLAIELAMLGYALAQVFPPHLVLLRLGVAYSAAVGVAWATDLHSRSAFVREVLSKQRQKKLSLQRGCLWGGW